MGSIIPIPSFRIEPEKPHSKPLELKPNDGLEKDAEHPSYNITAAIAAMVCSSLIFYYLFKNSKPTDPILPPESALPPPISTPPTPIIVPPAGGGQYIPWE